MVEVTVGRVIGRDEKRCGAGTAAGGKATSIAEDAADPV